jgi:hypothetical protein
MRKITLIILFFKLCFVHSQTIETNFVDSVLLKADNFIGIDAFENYYYTIGTTFYKKTKSKAYSYTNTQLGTISSIDITNPLKIVLFYSDFNTIVLLDNRLNELSNNINLSTESFAKNVTFASISSNNNFWLYSLDDNILSLWNYETRQAVFDTQPLSYYQKDFEANIQISTYEYCWLISNTHVLKFNEYGSYIDTFKEIGIERLVPYNQGILYLKNDKIYFANASLREPLTDNKKHKLDNFFVAKDNLYFFDTNVLYKYTLFKK